MPRMLAIAAIVSLALAAALQAPPATAVGNNDDNATAPERPSPYTDAVQAVKAKEYRRAIRLLEIVIEDEPRNANALNYMGYSQRKLGKFDAAIVFYKRALAVDPDHEGANEYIGEAYLEINDLPMAEKHLVRLRSICGTRCEAYRELADAVAAYKAKRRPEQSSRAVPR